MKRSYIKTNILINFFFDILDFPATLVQGVNTICVEVHNQTANSSDLTCRPFLSFGIDTPTFTYYQTPTWFNPPITFYNSTLPIVVLNTNNVEIPDEPKIHATMGILVREDLRRPSPSVAKLSEP